MTPCTDAVLDSYRNTPAACAGALVRALRVPLMVYCRRAPCADICQYRALQMCCTDSVLLGICPFPADSSAAPAFTETSGMFGLVRPVEVCKVLEQTDRHRLLSRRTRGSFVRRSSRRSALQVGSRPFGRRLRHCKVTRRFSLAGEADGRRAFVISGVER